MSVQISYRKQFVFYILLIIIFLVVVEGLVRLYETSYVKCDFIGKDALEHIDLKTQQKHCYDGSYFLHTNIEGIRMSKPNQHFPTININSFGFRGPEITQEKPLDTIRIFALGGSTTFGSVTTSDFTTIPGFLQKKIDKDHSSTVQVINAGILGANSSMEKQLLKNYVGKFNPDIIIIYDGANNASIGLYLKQANIEDDTAWAIITYVYQFYRTPTFIYKNFVHEGFNLNIDEKMADQLAQSWKDDWKEACSQKRDYKIIIFIQPILSNKKFLSEDESRQLKLDPRNEQTNYNLEKIADISSELKGICDGVFDLRSSFENVTEPLFFDNVHVNDLGNKIIAEKMYEKLYPFLT